MRDLQPDGLGRTSHGPTKPPVYATASAETVRQRAAALQAMAVLDTPPEQGFDALTRLAAQIFDARIACVSLIDGERVWFKSVVGLDVKAADSHHTLCAEVANSKQPLEVCNALLDPRFVDNPMVNSALGIRYYAGAPILYQDLAIGAVCVLDPLPREMPARSLSALEDLALLATLLLRARIDAFQMYSASR